MKDLYGRLLVGRHLTDEQKSLAKSLPSMYQKQGRTYCQRCASLIEASWCLPSGDYYCRNCLLLGRIDSKEPLYYFPAQPFPRAVFLNWEGTLTPYQEKVSNGLKQGLRAKQNLLVQAVTGAGKTEMIYGVVAEVLEQGGHVCLASPRVDVCIELFNRLSRDFSCDITLLHGNSDPYRRAPLVIATTHQLLKFYQAFDLLIIDEVDAFPFVDNEMLYHGVNNSLKEEGVKIFLTATSTVALENQVRHGDIQQLDLARRFHANPLVVPKMVWLGGLLKALKKGKLPKKLLHLIKYQRQTNYPLLLFFPHIQMGEEFTEILKRYFPNESIGFVSSKTEERLSIVQKFRDGHLTMLVATTILERGVTFPCVDVFVVWSNHKLYTKSSLVQISGRVGRAKERPTGELIFFHDGITKAMQQAKKEIQVMNQRGGF